jgi:acyl carrier protein
MTHEQIQATVRAFVEEHFLVTFGADFDLTTNLFETQIIDSFGFVELVRFLEREFAIEIRDPDLVSGALTSIAHIVDLVKERAHDSIGA